MASTSTTRFQPSQFSTEFTRQAPIGPGTTSGSMTRGTTPTSSDAAQKPTSGGGGFRNVVDQITQAAQSAAQIQQQAQDLLSAGGMTRGGSGPSLPGSERGGVVDFPEEEEETNWTPLFIGGGLIVGGLVLLAIRARMK